MKNKKGLNHIYSTYLVVFFLIAFIVVFLVGASPVCFGSCCYDQVLNTTSDVHFHDVDLTGTFGIGNYTKGISLTDSEFIQTTPAGAFSVRSFSNSRDTDNLLTLFSLAPYNNALYFEFDNNVQVDGDLTANNICYSNGTNCGSSFNSSNYYNKTQEDTNISNAVASLSNSTIVRKGATSKSFLPSNPSLVSQSSYRMLGLGSTINITPTSSGIVELNIDMDPSAGALTLGTYHLRYGSGAAPAYNAVESGTLIGLATRPIPGVAGTDNMQDIIISGLTLNTNYWFDASAIRSSGVNGVGVINVRASLKELPY